MLLFFIFNLIYNINTSRFILLQKNNSILKMINSYHAYFDFFDSHFCMLLIFLFLII